MRPKTLLEMAGLAAAAPRLSQAAVVMIDAQHEYLDGKLALPAIGPALNEIERLLARARALRTPIIHVVHHGKAGGAFAPGSPGAEIAAQAAPAPGEAVVAKGLPNAFASTDLADRLHAGGGLSPARRRRPLGSAGAAGAGERIASRVPAGPAPRVSQALKVDAARRGQARIVGWAKRSVPTLRSVIISSICRRRRSVHSRCDKA